MLSEYFTYEFVPHRNKHKKNVRKIWKVGISGGDVSSKGESRIILVSGTRYVRTVDFIVLYLSHGDLEYRPIDCILTLPTMQGATNVTLISF